MLVAYVKINDVMNVKCQLLSWGVTWLTSSKVFYSCHVFLSFETYSIFPCMISYLYYTYLFWY